MNLSRIVYRNRFYLPYLRGGMKRIVFKETSFTDSPDEWSRLASLIQNSVSKTGRVRFSCFRAMCPSPTNETVTESLVVDGQNGLLSVVLLLAGLAAVARESGNHEFATYIISLYLSTQDGGPKFIVPQTEAKPLTDLIAGNPVAAESAVARGFLYLKASIETIIQNGASLDEILCATGWLVSTDRPTELPEPTLVINQGSKVPNRPGHQDFVRHSYVSPEDRKDFYTCVRIVAGQLSEAF